MLDWRKRQQSRAQVRITIEENTIMGGFGANLRNWCSDNSIKTERFFTLGIPDDFVTHGSRNQLLDDVGLSPEKITEFAAAVLGGKVKSGDVKELVK